MLVNFLWFCLVCVALYFIIGFVALVYAFFQMVVPFLMAMWEDKAVLNVSMFALGYCLPLWVHVILAPILVPVLIVQTVIGFLRGKRHMNDGEGPVDCKDKWAQHKQHLQFNYESAPSDLFKA